MAKYLYIANYTLEGTKGLLKDGGTGRREAVAKMAASMDGKLEAFYFGFGDDDAYVIIDAPDNVSAAAAALTVAAGGGATVRTVVLLTPEEIDQAAKKTPQYRAPGA